METKRSLSKRFDTVVANEIVSGMVWRRLRYSELKYGTVLRNLDIFWANYVLRSLFFFYSSQKPHGNHVFPRFNHSSIVTYVTNSRLNHILSRRSNLVNSLQAINFFLNCSANSLKKHHIKCSNDEKSILGFSSL